MVMLVVLEVVLAMMGLVIDQEELGHQDKVLRVVMELFLVAVPEQVVVEEVLVEKDRQVFQHQGRVMVV